MDGHEAAAAAGPSTAAAASAAAAATTASIATGDALGRAALFAVSDGAARSPKKRGLESDVEHSPSKRQATAGGGSD